MVLWGLTFNTDETNFVRIHIVANSFSSVDSDVSKTVASEIADFLTPSFSALSADEREDFVTKNLLNICGIANEILAQNNCDYKSSVSFDCRHFEEEVCENVTVKEGNYDVLDVYLGSGAGSENALVISTSQLKTAVYKSRIF